MPDPDLRAIPQLPIVVPRAEIKEYIERIEELRVRLEQHNAVADRKRELRKLIRVGTAALKSNDPDVLKAAIATMLGIADKRLT